MIDARDMARLVARGCRLRNCAIVHRFEGVRQASGGGEYVATVEIKERADPQQGIWYGVEISDADGHRFVGEGGNTVDAAMLTAPWSQLDDAALGRAQGVADTEPSAAASDLGAPNRMPTEEEGGES
jgi:hypothetical protein